LTPGQSGADEYRQGSRFAVGLADAATSALIEEAELTPKPALVDRRGSGAHFDLNLALLRRSAEALHPGFVRLAQATSCRANAGDDLQLRADLGRIGRDMEHEMLAATGGSNAHRGAIWAIGLLVAAASQNLAERRPPCLAAAAAALARLPDRFAPRPNAIAAEATAPCLSHGQCARLRFGAAGARGQAQSAFPQVIHAGLPALRAARRCGAPEDCARLDALMAIMAELDDTCLLHRGGLRALETAQSGAKAVLALGGTASAIGMRRLGRLQGELMAMWASPGGSADLLAVTLFLDRLERRFDPVVSRQGHLNGNAYFPL
jgi:triphosphoribosyl-dephospho-CoA synthase